MTNTATVSSTTGRPERGQQPGERLRRRSARWADVKRHAERFSRPRPGRRQPHLHARTSQRGADPASAVTVSDPLPAGLTLVSSTSTRAPAPAPPPSRCKIGTVNTGAANDVTVTIVATAGQAALRASSTRRRSPPRRVTRTARTTRRAPRRRSTRSPTSSSPRRTHPTRSTAGANLTYTLPLQNTRPELRLRRDSLRPTPGRPDARLGDLDEGHLRGHSTVSCNLGTVSAGAANDVTVTIVARPDRPRCRAS